MQPDLLLLIKACESGLHISKPIHLQIKTQVKGDIKNLAGYCDSYIRRGKISGHKIVIHLDTVLSSEYSIYDVIAHELIHASMLENGHFDADYHHDNTFQELANHLTHYLTNLGFNIGCLYDPLIDTE